METKSEASKITELKRRPGRQIVKSHKLDDVCYDIRGPVLKEAHRLKESGRKR